MTPRLRLPFLATMLLLGTSLFGASAPLLVTAGSFSPADLRTQMADRYAVLNQDSNLLTPATTTSVPLSQADAHALSNGSDDVNAPPLVGRNLPVDRAVSLSGADLGAAVAKPLVVAGGVLSVRTNGSAAWTTAVESPGANGLRLHFTGFSLPAGTEMYIYTVGEKAGEVYGPWTGAGPLGNGDFWTNTVLSSTAYIEVRPTGVVQEHQFDGVRFTIAHVAHLGPNFLASLKEAQEVLPPPIRRDCTDFNVGCVTDVNCPAASWPMVPSVRLAVALMVFSVDGGQYLCTGSLLNDTDAATTKNFFLTANHCISSQGVASTLECYFRYSTASCNGTPPDYSTFPRALGSTYLDGRSAAEVSDFTLLLLSQNPPAGSTYLGWTTERPAIGTTLYRLSHPVGEPLSYSTQSVIAPRYNCGFPTADFLFGNGLVGGARHGSSGSAICREDGIVVGQLYGVCGGICDICNHAAKDIIDGFFGATYTFISSQIDNAPTPTPTPAPFGCGSNTGGTLTDSDPDTFNDGTHTDAYQFTLDGDRNVSLSMAGSGFRAYVGVYPTSGGQALIDATAQSAGDVATVTGDLRAGTYIVYANNAVTTTLPANYSLSMNCTTASWDIPANVLTTLDDTMWDPISLAGVFGAPAFEQTGGLKMTAVDPTNTVGWWQTKGNLIAPTAGRYRLTVNFTGTPVVSGKRHPEMRVRLFRSDNRVSDMGLAAETVAGQGYLSPLTIDWTSDGSTPWRIAIDMLSFGADQEGGFTVTGLSNDAVAP